MGRGRPDLATITILTSSDADGFVPPDPSIYRGSPFALWCDPQHPKNPLKDPPMPRWFELKTPAERLQIHQTCCEWKGLPKEWARARIDDETDIIPGDRWYTWQDNSTQCGVTGRWRGGLIEVHGAATLPPCRYNAGAFRRVQRDQDEAIRLAGKALEHAIHRLLGCLAPEPSIGGMGVEV